MPLFHFPVHVSPGRENSLAPDIRKRVHRLVQYAHSEIGHPYLIGIRKTERDTDIDVFFVLDYLVVFPSDIPRRLLYFIQNSSQIVCHSLTSLKTPRSMNLAVSY